MYLGRDSMLGKIKKLKLGHVWAEPGAVMPLKPVNQRVLKSCLKIHLPFNGKIYGLSLIWRGGLFLSVLISLSLSVKCLLGEVYALVSMVMRD